MTASEEEGVSLICDTPIELPLSKIFEERKFTMLSTSIHHKRLSGVACTSGDFAWICGPDHATFYKVDKKGIILIRISININPIYICANERTIFYSDYTDNSIKLHDIEDDDFYIFGENTSVERTIYTNDRHWCPMALTNSRTFPKNCVILVCEFNLNIGHGSFVDTTLMRTVYYRLLSTWMIIIQFLFTVVFGPLPKTSMATSGS